MHTWTVVIITNDGPKQKYSLTSDCFDKSKEKHVILSKNLHYVILYRYLVIYEIIFAQ